MSALVYWSIENKMGYLALLTFWQIKLVNRVHDVNFQKLRRHEF